MVSGGFSGIISWLVSYPFDQVKSKMQTSLQHVTARQIAMEGWQKEGFTYFYRGLGITCVRTFLVNAITLPLFDFIQDNICKQYS